MGNAVAKFGIDEWIILWLLDQDDFAFQWDTGNRTKNYEKHKITCEEAESIFKNKLEMRALGTQITPVVDEIRYGAFGKTDTQKIVFVCFTLKDNQCVRIISVRTANKKEIILYEKLCETEQ
jgi:uncharacterized DUF497 family protein